MGKVIPLKSEHNRKYFNNQKNPAFRTKKQRGLFSTDPGYRSKILCLSKEDVKLIDIFCDNPNLYFTSNQDYKDKYFYSYPYWSRGSQRCWDEVQQGGTGIMTILIWYHHYFKPGSKEYRVKIIIKNLLNYLRKQNKRNDLDIVITVDTKDSIVNITGGSVFL